MNTQAIDTAKSLLRIQKYLERLELAKGYHKEYIHTFINKNNTKVPLLTADLKALLQQVAITPAHEDAREHARIAELESQLSAIGAGGVEPLRKQAEDGWIQDGPLLYRLTDERRPRNRDEINVTMANSSRTEEARTRRASELLHAIRAAAPQAVPACNQSMQPELATYSAQTRNKKGIEQ